MADDDQDQGEGQGQGQFDLGKMLQAAQQVKSKLDDVQQKLGQLTVEADAGGGMVTVKANAAGEVMEVRIDPTVVDPEELDMLQDLIVAACNMALEKGRQRAKEEMQNEVSRVAPFFPPIPGLFG
jgi:DNA-binding YbaB/EbfC family protein